MARLPYVDDTGPDAKVKELLDWVTEVEGYVPNHFRLELHFPEHFKAWLSWVRILWREGELSFQEVQQVGIAISESNDCAYCTGSFCSVLEHGGAVDRAAVEEYLARQVATLDKRQRALVEFAVEANLRPHAIKAEHIERLRRVGLGDRGIVQLVWLVNMFAASNRFNTVLATDFDAQNEYQATASRLLGVYRTSGPDGSLG
jgi:uncharacterized peroxidase-related enzyme